MRPEELGAWQALLQEEFEKPYWRTLAERVDAAYTASTVYPPREELFAAFRMTPPEAVRVVILGQDPSAAGPDPAAAQLPARRRRSRRL